jgi:hypothetical protein
MFYIEKSGVGSRIRTVFVNMRILLILSENSFTKAGLEIVIQAPANSNPLFAIFRDE